MGKLGRYLRDNLVIVIAILVIFAAGIVAGALGSKSLSPQQYGDLQQYVDLVLRGSGDWEVDSFSLARETIWSHLKIVVLIWFLGLTVIGIPLILGIVFLRGLILGFSVGFLIGEKALAGFLLTIFSILPQNLLLVPALLFAAISAVVFSYNLVRGKFNRSLELSRCLLSYSLLFAAAVLAVGAGGLVEAYLSPAFIKLIAVYF